MSTLDNSADANNFLASLPASLRETLLLNSRQIEFKNGQRIHNRGDRKPSLSIIVSGAVRFSNLGLDGERITTSTLQPGEAFGEFTLFTDMPRMHDADAAGNTLLAVIPHERFELLLSDEQDLRRFIIGFLARRLLTALELLEDERRLPLPMRLAKLLVRSPGSVADPMIITMTQNSLAEELAVSRVALGAALKKLKSMDYVQLGYGQVKIINNEGLERWIRSESQLVPLASGA